MITLTVTSGSCNVPINFGHVNGEAVSLISPDNTPMYNFAIYNEDGHFVIGADSISSQKVKIVEPFQLDGVCSLVITNAVDDGVYQLKIFTR